MPNEVVLHLNSLAANRKTANVKQPVFENSYTIFDDDNDVDDDPELSTIPLTNLLTQKKSMKSLKTTNRLKMTHTLSHNNICTMKTTHRHWMSM